VLLSQSRGAILMGIPAALIVVLIFWYGRRAVIPVALAVIGIVVVMIPLSLVLPRLGDLFGETLTFRRHLWFSSVELLKERPIRGVGLDQFLYWYRSRYLVPEAWEEPNLSIPHNIVLNYWVNLGILGVVIGIALQGVFWQTMWRIRARVANTDPVLFALVLGLAGSMADALVHGLVDVGYFAINLAFVFFLSLALLSAIQTMTPPLRRVEFRADRCSDN
jgi:putative inorganic carbon (HCO3(-)) transporter